MKLQYTKHDTVSRMVDSLTEFAEREEKSLHGITLENFNSFLDDLFEDGGEARCEEFCDIAWDYSLQFGPLESTEQSRAQWACIEAAIKRIRKGLAQ